MSERLKKGWTRVVFGDVVQLCRERSIDPVKNGFERYVGLEHLEPGDLKIRRWGSVADGTTFTSVFRAGQVLFGKRRVYQRKVAVADFDGVCSSDIYVFEPKNDHLLSELLPFCCQTDGFLEHAVGTSAGSLSPRTNWESLASYEFALPPLDEQRRLAKVLKATDDSVQSLASMHRALDAVLCALARQLLLEPEDGKGTPIGRFATLDIEAIEVDRATSYRSVGVLNGGQGLFTREAFLGAATKYARLIRLRTGQVVMRKLTAWEGAISVVPAAFDGFVVSAEFPTLTLDQSQVIPSYMEWVFQQPWFWRRMKAECKGTAVRRARLHPSDLCGISITLPPVPEQRNIVARLKAVKLQAGAVVQRLSEVRDIGGHLLAKFMGDYLGAEEIRRS